MHYKYTTTSFETRDFIFKQNTLAYLAENLWLEEFKGNIGKKVASSI